MNFASKYCLLKRNRVDVTNDLDNAAETGLLNSISVGPSQRGGRKRRGFRKKKHAAEIINDVPAVAEVDTNVVSVSFGTLTEAAKSIMAGDATICENVICKGVFNHLSKLVEKKDANTSLELDDDDKLWICEFCGTHNAVCLDDDEIPTEDTLDFILKPAPADSKRDDTDSGLLIFVLDVSGSMAVTTEVEGNFELRGAKPIDMDAFGGGQVPNFINRQRRRSKVTYVSRLQAVQAAVDKQLESCAEQYPNKKVCIITFSNDVTIWGDGSSPPVTLSGPQLQDAQALKDAGKAFNVAASIKDSRTTLVDKLFSLEENGPTALGPALLVAVAMTEGGPASTVVVCTDGLANVGLGALDTVDTDEGLQEIVEWYEGVGNMAKQEGTTCSIISIKGDECALENLGKVAEATGGDVDRVDPMELTKNFAGILANPVLATGVQCTFLLNKFLEFRNLEENDDSAVSILDDVDTKATDNKTRTSSDSDDTKTNPAETGGKKEDKAFRIIRDVGNVNKDTEELLEYTIRSDDTSAFAGMESIPFQVQIIYTALNGGQFMRVITATQLLTDKQEVAEEDVKVELLTAHVAQRTAKLAAKGKYRASRINNVAYGKLMNRCAKTSSQRQTFSTWSAQAEQLDDLVLEQQVQASPDLFEVDNDDLKQMESAGVSSRSKRVSKLMKGRKKGKQKASDSSYSMFHAMSKTNSRSYQG